MPLSIRQLSAHLPAPGARAYTRVEALVDLARLQHMHVELPVNQLATRWKRKRGWCLEVVSGLQPSVGDAQQLPLVKPEEPQGETRTDPERWAPMLQRRLGGRARAIEFVRFHLPKIEGEADAWCAERDLAEDGPGWNAHVRTRLWAYLNREKPRTVAAEVTKKPVGKRPCDIGIHFTGCACQECHG